MNFDIASGTGASAQHFTADLPFAHPRLIRSIKRQAVEIKLPVCARLTLGALCDHSDGLGKCFPSQVTIAEETGLSRRSVIRGVQSLERAGLIQRHVPPPAIRARRGPEACTKYQIRFVMVTSEARDMAPEPRAIPIEKARDTEIQDHVTPCHPKKPETEDKRHAPAHTHTREDDHVTVIPEPAVPVTKAVPFGSEHVTGPIIDPELEPPLPKLAAVPISAALSGALSLFTGLFELTTTPQLSRSERSVLNRVAHAQARANAEDRRKSTSATQAAYQSTTTERHPRTATKTARPDTQLNLPGFAAGKVKFGATSGQNGPATGKGPLLLDMPIEDRTKLFDEVWTRLGRPRTGPKDPNRSHSDSS